MLPITQNALALKDPRVCGALPAYLLITKPQPDLAHGGIDLVAGVDEVASDLQRIIGADGAGGSFGRPGGADHLAHGSDGIGAFHHHRHDRRADDVVDQSVIKTLALMLGIVLARQRFFHLFEAHSNNLEATALEALDDFADQTTL